MRRQAQPYEAGRNAITRVPSTESSCDFELHCRSSVSCVRPGSACGKWRVPEHSVRDLKRTIGRRKQT